MEKSKIIEGGRTQFPSRPELRVCAKASVIFTGSFPRYLRSQGNGKGASPMTPCLHPLPRMTRTWHLTGWFRAWRGSLGGILAGRSHSRLILYWLPAARNSSLCNSRVSCVCLCPALQHSGEIFLHLLTLPLRTLFLGLSQHANVAIDE